MKREIETAAEIAAMRKLGMNVDSRWVDWAVRMLVEGHDTPSLRRLAGESGPFDQWEMSSLVGRTLGELGVHRPRTVDEAVLVYAAGLVKQLTSPVDDLGGVLSELAGLCIEHDHPRALHSFYLLHFAFGDLQVSEEQWYWDGATRGNIHDVVAREARTWIEAHGGHVRRDGTEHQDSPDH